ncbi:hypothetical protein TNCT_732291 [Trichonephila clavata]|uniref:Uncharacterized protein n=1 Tax=Trichonephila clavata TaxID=2740835 RepID=A0A8X6LNG5_TRICU|nr:hypothetical protein TNCT_732291 [Trichonephila clavata]
MRLPEYTFTEKSKGKKRDPQPRDDESGKAILLPKVGAKKNDMVHKNSIQGAKCWRKNVVLQKDSLRKKEERNKIDIWRKYFSHAEITINTNYGMGKWGWCAFKYAVGRMLIKLYCDRK